MGRKRKLVPKSTQSAEPPLKHHHSQQQQQQHLQKQEDQAQFEPDKDNGVEYEEVEVEEEVEEEEEEEVEEEEEEEDAEEDEADDDDNHNPAKAPSTSSLDGGGGVDGDEDDEPIQELLEPFSKEQIVTLLFEAANKHRDVADRIRKVADEDAVHRKIFVHGLGWDTNADTLINVFRQYGEIEDCRAVCDKISGKSKGYGFILFKTRRGARKALEQPQKKIGNRMTACQLALIGPVQQQPGVVSAPPASEYAQRKIYVTNVGADLDPQKLLMFFSRFGEIEEGPLGLDKVTGKPKGFCLFVYKSIESAKRALEEPHKDFEGHILRCQKAIDGPKPGKNQQQQQQNPQRAQFQRNENPGFVGGASSAPGHLMAPAGPGIGYNQGVAGQQQSLNPALGQALTALLASQGGTLGLSNLLGTFASPAAVNPGVPAAGHGIQGGYSSQPNISPAVIGGYGNQVGLQGAYQNQQMGQGGSGRGQQGGGQYGGVAPYMGH